MSSSCLASGTPILDDQAMLHIRESIISSENNGSSAKSMGDLFTGGAGLSLTQKMSYLSFNTLKFWVKLQPVNPTC